jgi:hypothetical protein
MRFTRPGLFVLGSLLAASASSTPPRAETPRWRGLEPFRLVEAISSGEE